MPGRNVPGRFLWRKIAYEKNNHEMCFHSAVTSQCLQRRKIFSSFFTFSNQSAYQLVLSYQFGDFEHYTVIIAKAAVRFNGRSCLCYALTLRMFFEIKVFFHIDNLSNTPNLFTLSI